MRNRESIKQYVLELLENTLSAYSSGSITTMVIRKTIMHIEEDTMLHVSQAKIVEAVLTDSAITQLDNLYPAENSTNIIMDIDELSIIPEAWSVYCRPGTYRVDPE